MSVSNLIFNMAIADKLPGKDTFEVWIEGEYKGKLVAKDEWEAAKIYSRYTGAIVERIDGIEFRCFGRMPVDVFLERKVEFIPPLRFRDNFSGFAELMDGTDVVRD